MRAGGGRVGTYDGLAKEILGREAQLGDVRLVAVDGRAGSGKTTFAGRLARALRHAGIDVAELHTDDFLDGWADLEAWRPRLEEWVFAPFKAGEDARCRRYDWAAERLREEWEPLRRPEVLIVEGVGSAAVQDLTLAVCVRAPEALRLERGLIRDGEALRPQWERWMAGEDRFFGDGRVLRRVDVHVDGAPGEEHDPQNEYFILAGG
ncbi:AAA family ATPase [Dactylosporangium sp. NPDC005555]|uniref:uridine kinase family protein n=1 Tax=Dactylosporangium sp. NPDC005555 TaxID=3154889 RepID=UPI0033BDB823